MNKKKIAGIIASIFICTVIGISTQNIYASDSINNEGLIPTSEQIKQKEHFKELTKIASSNGLTKLELTSSVKSYDQINKKINNYLDSLDTNTLILTIAETADEVDKNKDHTALDIFASASEKKLIPNLSTDDYIQFLDSDQLSQSFKAFMIDTAVYAKKNNTIFNDKLREIIKNSGDNGNLKSYSADSSVINSNEQLVNFSLQSINNYNANDIPMLKNILDSNKYNSIAKSTSIYKLSDIDKVTTDTYLTSILENKDKYCNEEIRASMFILSKYFKIATDKEKYKSLFLENAKDILSNAQSSDLTDAAIFSLGETKDKDAIKLIANNVNNIKDDAIISYFVDMNFSTINKMLDSSNPIDDINSALTLAQISRYDDFSTNLEKLKSNPDKNIAEKSQSILNELDKIKDNPIKRNTKWDNYN